MKAYTNKQNFGIDFYPGNPGLGCYRKSEACQNCFIHYLNRFENNEISLPLQFSKLPSGTVIHVTLFSDFFLAEADAYRSAAGQEIKKHPNLIFLIITKRPERIKACLPEDGGDGWENVVFAITMENKKRVEERMPILLSLSCKHKGVACTPLLEELDLLDYLKTGQIEHVEISGEKSYNEQQIARPLSISGVQKLKQQCQESKVRLSFLSAGHNCILMDGTNIKDTNTCYHSEIADSLDISHYEPLIFNLPDGTFTY